MDTDFSGGEEDQNPDYQIEVSKHYVIKFTSLDKVSICLQKSLCSSFHFWYSIFNCLLCCCSLRKRGSRFEGICSRNRRLARLFDKANSRLEQELDLPKLLARVREHDIALKSSILCAEGRRNMIQHT